MPQPQGELTPSQLEIMDVVWEQGEASIGEIWTALSRSRELARTTVQTQVERLEKRGWLRRIELGRRYRFAATQPRAHATRGLVARFVDRFFAGSAGSLVMHLLGNQRLDPDELERVRALLGDHEDEG